MMRVSSASSSSLQRPEGQLFGALGLFRLLTFGSHTAMTENIPVAVSAVCVASTNDSADGFPMLAMGFKCPTKLSGDVDWRVLLK